MQADKSICRDIKYQEDDQEKCGSVVLLKGQPIGRWHQGRPNTFLCLSSHKATNQLANEPRRVTNHCSE